MKILYLIDSFDCDSSTRQLQLLGPNLRPDDRVEICCLGPATSALRAMRQAGVIVHALEWTRWVDPAVLWNLRAVVCDSAPDLIHVWRLPALRALALAAKSMLPRAVVSAALPAHGKLAWWDRWLLEQVGCVALAGGSNQADGARHGIRKPMVRVVAPALARAESVQDGAEERSADAAKIVYVGRIDRADGARHAVWAFDILRHLFPDTRLQMVGAESTATEIRDLVEGLQVTSQVEFLGLRPDLPALLRGASVVWLPRLTNRGRQVALDAMAHGRIVIGSDVPCLREVIRDRETGYLVPVGNVMEMARRTRLIFQDSALRERMELAARVDVAQRFPLENTVAQWRQVYRSVAA